MDEVPPLLRRGLVGRPECRREHCRLEGLVFRIITQIGGRKKGD